MPKTPGLCSRSTLRKRVLWLGLVVSMLGCSVIAERQLVKLYGTESVRDRVLPESELSEQAVDFWRDVKPILDRRCVVCHSCYDAPCQLKLSSIEGLDRGAFKKKIYDGARLFELDPMRLYIDADNTSAWRAKGFYPVLNERDQSPAANLESSVLYRMLALKRRHPLPTSGLLPAAIDLTDDAGKVCPAADEMDYFERAYPLWGMPYGLPALPEQEFLTLRSWLQDGAKVKNQPALSGDMALKVRNWEKFFNGGSLKEQLMSRYLYEHLFLADLYFAGRATKTYFKLVRSLTPPGQEIEIVRTRRVYDDPGSKRIYYRLKLTSETKSAKTHLPYPLNAQRMRRYSELFLQQGYQVSALPGYEPEFSSNPFKTFQDIPATSRYRFLLDDAHFFIANFIKGPVCRGQTAINVLSDRFWVLFANPERELDEQHMKFLTEEGKRLQLPAAWGSNTGLLLNWLRITKAQKKYLKAKRKFAANDLADYPALTIDDIWDGGKTDPDAALTIFRHYDNASVVTGLVGATPKTAWVIGYPLFEQIYYLLVAGFDVYGNVGHQVLTRIYMDFLRVDGENNFLAFLPTDARRQEHAFWYRGIGADRDDYLISEKNFEWREPFIEYKSENPKQEFFGKVARHLGKALSGVYRLPENAAPALKKIDALKGVAASVLPESSLIRIIKESGESDVYTLLLNRALTNVAVLYLENLRYLPDEDDVTLAAGFATTYPNAFFVVGESELEDFAAGLAKLSSEEDYHALTERYGVRRTNPKFWGYSDWFQTAYQESSADADALLDYNRLENR